MDVEDEGDRLSVVVAERDLHFVLPLVVLEGDLEIVRARDQCVVGAIARAAAAAAAALATTSGAVVTCLSTGAAHAAVAPPQGSEQLTARLLEQIELEHEQSQELVPIEETLAEIDADFGRPSLDSRYHGAYLGRSPVQHTATASALYAARPKGREAIIEALDALYPEELGDKVEQLRDLEHEHAMLEALRDGFLAAPGGIIRHRGRMMRSKQLPAAIEQVEREREAARGALVNHDMACRTAHLAAARKHSRVWRDYLRSLLKLLHYATHSQANLNDAAGHLDNVFSVVIADGRVSSNEMVRLVAAANEVYDVLSQLHRHASDVVLPDVVAEQLEVDSWTATLPEDMDLTIPGPENIGDWLQVLNSWLGAYGGPLGALRRVCLDLLLETESHLADCLRSGEEPDAPPRIAGVPSRYETLVVGEERPRQKKLDWWDRFQLADGIGPSIARFAVATAIVGAVMALGGAVGNPSAVIYNGLHNQVTVSIGDRTVTLNSLQSAQVDLPRGKKVKIETRIHDGPLIERFEAPIEQQFGTHIYNVAAATPMVAWTAHYGSASPEPELQLGAKRWFAHKAGYYFREPPKEIRTKSSGGKRTVLTALGGGSALGTLSQLKSEQERSRVALAHARWGALDEPMTGEWLRVAAQQAGFAKLIDQRLGEAPQSIELKRLQMDVAPDTDAREKLCRKHRADASSKPDDLDLQYLRIRCMARGLDRDEAALALHSKSPQHRWLSLFAGYVYAQRGSWAMARLKLAHARSKIYTSRGPLALDEARLRRVSAALQQPPATPALSDLAQISSHLRRYLALGSGEGLPEGPIKAFSKLGAGQIDSAMSYCSSSAQLRREAVCKLVVPLAAGSEGASPSLAKRALSVPVEELDQNALFSLLALARRIGVDRAPYEKAIRAAFPAEADILLSFADPDALRADAGFTKAEAKLETLRMTLRGQACVMALILLGDDAPAHWRTQAKALLFVTERPYLR